MSFDFVPGQDTDRQLDRLLNRGLTLQDNVRCAILHLELTEGEYEVRHGLGFVPLGYVILVKDAPVAIYGRDTNRWTSEVIYVQAEGPVAARIAVL